MKMVKFAAIGLAVMLLVPSVSSAVTVEELQAQLTGLQQIMAKLQAQVNLLPPGIAKKMERNGVKMEVQKDKAKFEVKVEDRDDDDEDDDNDDNRTIPVSFCRTFNANIGVGAKGDEVVKLKTALQLEGFGSFANQGIFDEQTASAVTGFQQKYASEILAPLGLQFGTGFVGKSTRTKLNALYGCVKPDSGAIRVISPNGGEVFVKGEEEQISWKNKSPFADAWVALFLLKDKQELVFLRQGLPLSGSYMWSVPETYCTGDVCGDFPLPVGNDYRIEARLYKGPALCVVGLCPRPTTPVTLLASDTSDASFTIMSSTSTNQPPALAKVDGPASLQVGETGTWTIIANDPESGSLSYRVVWGDEAFAVTAPAQESMSLQTSQRATFTHSYANAGVYYPTFTVTDASGLSATRTLAVKVGNVSTNLPPSINGVSGPTVLKAGETGTWTVTAKDPENKSLRYAVSWGDANVGGTAAAESSLAPSVYTQTATFTHAYSSAGAYTITVSVYDDQNARAVTSISVNVASFVISRYDLNGDSIVNAKDTTLLSEVILEKASCPIGKNCDLNGDDKVNVIDLNILIDFFTTLYDLNADRIDNQKDATLLSDIILAKRACPTSKICDLNGDGQTNVVDLTILINHLNDRYDITADGKADINDQNLLVDVILGKTTCPNPTIKVCDFNRDGAVNVLDHGILTDYILSVSPSPTPSLRGIFDYNNDKQLNVADTQVLSNVVSRIVSCPADKKCDVNSDGTVNASDVTILMDFILARYDFSGDGVTTNTDVSYLNDVILATRSCPAGKICDVSRDSAVNVIDSTLLFNMVTSNS